MLDEITEGLALIDENEKNITIFGSARVMEDSTHYQQARDMAKYFGQSGYNIISGGGPGIMQAVSQGGHEAGVKTYGINIVLPHEQTGNKYLTHSYVCSNFYTRKYILIAKSCAVVACAGGFGTLDELYEVLTLLTTDSMPQIPVILIGREFWQNIYVDVADKLQQQGLISETDRNIVKIVDTKDEALAIIEKFYNK